MKLGKALGMPKVFPKTRLFPRWKDLHGIDTKSLDLPSMRVTRKRGMRLRDIFKDV